MSDPHRPPHPSVADGEGSPAPERDGPWARAPGEGAPPPDQGGPRRREPIFTGLPLVVLVLVAAIIGVQALDEWSLANERIFHALTLQYGALATGPLADQLPTSPWGGFSPYVLHVFVHGGWMHALLNAGALLAFGAAAMRPFGRGLRAAAGFLAFYSFCAVCGAALHAVLYADVSSYMVGASTAISGVLAAAGWSADGRKGMLRLAAPWLLINIALAVFGSFADMPIAWAGHIGGLLAGAATYPLFVRVFARRG